MSKICSLDLLDKQEFDLDIISSGGIKLFSKGDKITPEILLSLYFKEIFARKSIEISEDDEIENDKAEEQEVGVSLDEQSNLEQLIADQTPETIETLKFDKEHADRIVQLSCDLGAIVKMPKKNLEELKQAAYYYQIGRIKMTENDLSSVDFEKKQADIGYDLLTLEMKMSKKVAEVTRIYLEDYNCLEFELNYKKPANIPYSHIVSIVDYYDKLINKDSFTKEEALKKMLIFRGSKFNIFILHKFINMMRDLDD